MVIYDAAFFVNRNADDLAKTQLRHKNLVVGVGHATYRNAVSYDDDTVKEITEQLNDLAVRTQRAWIEGRTVVPVVETELIALLKDPFQLPSSGQEVELMRFKPMSYQPMSIATQTLRNTVKWISKNMSSDDVCDWASIVKDAWGVIDAHHRKLSEINKELYACESLWERARKPPIGSDAQFVRLGRPPKGKRGVNRSAPSWIRDRIRGLTESEADSAWKERIKVVAMKNGLFSSNNPCKLTSARRVWYKAARKEREARNNAHEATMLRMENVLDIDEDEYEFILENVADFAKKAENSKAEYFKLKPIELKTVRIVSIPIKDDVEELELDF